jgi:hypothetical protein
MDFAAAKRLADLLSPKSTGEPVNVHVVQPAKEPGPDFDAMQKLIESRELPGVPGDRNRDREK